MKNKMTDRVNARRYAARMPMLSIYILSSVFYLGIFFKVDAATEKTESKTKTSEPAIRHIQMLQVPQILLNFKFATFQSIWITSNDQWKKFWKDNSRITGDAPTLPLDWKTDSLLALFWPSKDDVVRIPAFMGIEENQTDQTKKLKLQFTLNKPCFGIITDQSPVQLMVVDHSMDDIDSLSVHTEQTRSMGCY